MSKSDKELFDEVLSIYFKVNKPLTYKLLIDNGFPKNAISRRLGGIHNICKELNIPCGDIRSTNSGKHLKSITVEEIESKLKASGKTHFSSTDVVQITGHKIGPLVRLYGSIEDLVIACGYSFDTRNHEDLRNKIICLLSFLNLNKDSVMDFSNETYVLLSLQFAGKENDGFRPNKRIYDEIYKRTSNIQIANSRYICKVYSNKGGWLQACRDAGFVVEQDFSCQSRWLSYFEEITGIPLIREQSFDTCINPKTGKRLFWDGYNEALKLLVEYQDPSHFMEISYYSGDRGLKERIYKDQIKVDWAKTNGYNLLVYTYKEGFNKTQIQKRLKEVLPNEH